MAKTVEQIKTELGITNETTLTQLLTLAGTYNVFSQAEINNIKSLSVMPLPNKVTNQAEELKARFTNIVLNDNSSAIHSINVRNVIANEILSKLDTLTTNLGNNKADLTLIYANSISLSGASGTLTDAQLNVITTYKDPVIYYDDGISIHTYHLFGKGELTTDVWIYSFGEYIYDISSNQTKLISNNITINSSTKEWSFTTNSDDIYNKTKIDSELSKITNGTVIVGKAYNDSNGYRINNTYSKISDIKNVLTDTSTNKPLSANMGKELKSMIDTINSILTSDDTSLDTVQEIITYIKSNKTLIDTLSTNKINVTDIVDNLTSELSNKPLSANMGKVLAERLNSLVSGLVSASYNESTGVLTLTYENDDTYEMKIGLSTTDKSNMADDVENVILADLFETFSTIKSYSTGDFVNYENNIYEFVSDKSSGAWDSTKVVIANLNDYMDEVNTSLANMTETIEGLGNLQPSGTDTSTNILAKTTADGIWIGSDTGHWYYWNGTQYDDGGVYLSSASDNKLSTESTNSIQNNVVTENIFALGGIANGITVEQGLNLLNLDLCTFEAYISAGGTYISITGDSTYGVTPPIFLKAGTYTEYRINQGYGSNATFLICDAKGNTISIERGGVIVSNKDLFQFTLTYDCFVLLNCSPNSYLVKGALSDYPSFIGEYKSNLKHVKIDGLDQPVRQNLDNLYITKSTNLFDKNRPSLQENKFFAADGSFISNNGFGITYPIFLKAGTYSAKSWTDYGTNSYVLRTTIDGDVIRTIKGTKETPSSPIVFTLLEDCYICLNYLMSDIGSCQLVTGSYPSTLPPYESYKIEISGLNRGAGVSYDYDSPLTRKVWYVCGDSATQGAFASITTPIFDSGLYAGQKKVYPFYIGNRTGMEVHNIAVSGGTIAEISDQPNRYQFSKDGNYNSVPTTADYITIWFGANDMWEGVPLGTIDSNDNTTFYGAWNKVLSYYINNYPNTKLGIVCSFWMTQTYAEAVINIAKKYGIPCLNLYNDPKIPVTVGSQRPDVSSNVKSTRNAQWVVSETNSHPSAKYHEIESYFIEEWLKTL